MSDPKCSQKSEANRFQFSIQELIQIILDEPKSKRLSSIFAQTSKLENEKTEKQRIKLQETINSLGFDSFVDHLVQKQLFLSKLVKEELTKQLCHRQNISTDLRKKVI